MLVNTELNDRNFISAINVNVISVAVYSINVFIFNKENRTSWIRSLKENSDQSKCYGNRPAIRDFT